MLEQQQTITLAGLEKNPQRLALARHLYEVWFTLHPDMRNPTDVNNKTKYDYFTREGWETLSLMQEARKQNVARHGYPFKWTQPEYWEDGEEIQ